MEDIHLSATRYFRNALRVIQLSPDQIVCKLDTLDQRGYGDEALEELGT